MDPDERYTMNEQAREEDLVDLEYFNHSKIKIMNAKRRKLIDVIKTGLEVLKDQLEEVRDQEEDYRDNIPENLQESERYYASDSNVDKLAEAVDYLSDAIINLEEIE
jgi:hypothetical protein